MKHSELEASALYRAWLQYDNVEHLAASTQYKQLLGQIVMSGDMSRSGISGTAVAELQQGVRSMLGLTPRVAPKLPSTSAYLSISVAAQDDSRHSQLHGEAFTLQYATDNEGQRLVLVGGSESGVLYGVFYLLRCISLGIDPQKLDVAEYPRNELRMINQWDNADGSIERGYAGNSIFYRDGKFIADQQRLKDYARLLASVGINAISINNVNVHEIETQFITVELLPDVARVADLFREYGIKLFLSVNFAAPLAVGGLATADPLDEDVQRWWRDTSSLVYKYIPDFGGFLVKADSEHRPGPFAYGRDHADGANMLARALEPHGGLVIWRCFVYNCMQDWRDRSTDRARAAYDHFMPLDGKFLDNVILQIKNGPMDFQVREPVSPLFGGLQSTNQMIEFQVTQEYTGQQRHLCYLVPQWKEVMDFNTFAPRMQEAETDSIGKKTKGTATEPRVKSIVGGSHFPMKHSGVAAVSNIGDDANWTGHTLAQVNLYGYGRLIWNPDLSAAEIAEEWAKLTFGSDSLVVETVCSMLLKSWEIYESYTAPLGVGWMVTPHYHYGPDVDGYEYSRWGTYHFADRDGIGVDRTAATGTGYAAQYFPPNAEMYESLDKCPDELLLFFHHVPYSHVLKSGKTVIQHIYDTRFAGAEEAERLLVVWKGMEGKVDESRYEQVAARLSEQAEHARHWRDVINTYFYRKSGVPDEHGRTIY
ncbi:alpha-glucuronidase family glycosyl hydrolase [Paenibacillus bouchesdurhonensis]|uniref:alpha-glucuronidase family glycosyl hydrolase n=1 Tax=Paenibacillus bouchesdurhonensis TaxID=1870990 RepID=UPI000DA5EE7A|nr:alpha-glucuronidase family glycosyl hydrolase [Paenibacillus bouchesdurhonensis]